MIKKIIFFDIDHGQINGRHLLTKHNSFFCINTLFIDGVKYKRWWVKNPFNDLIIIIYKEETISIKYNFFPFIKVTVNENISSYPIQTKKLYTGLIIFILIIILLTIFI